MIRDVGSAGDWDWEHCDDNDSGDHDDHKKNISNVMIQSRGNFMFVILAMKVRRREVGRS